LKNRISSSELGILWLTYQEKTLILRVLEYFIEKADDQQAKNIMGGLWQDLNYYVNKIKEIYENDGVVVPIGFQKGTLSLPPQVTMPDSIEFIESRSYLRGFNLFNEKKGFE